MLWTLSKAFLCKGQNPDHRRSCALDFADASVAQLVAQRIRNAWVAGSSPAGSFENKGIFLVSTFFCTQRDQYLLYSALLFQ